MALKVSLEIANNSSSLCVQRRISVSGTLAIDTAEEEALEFVSSLLGEGSHSDSEGTGLDR